MITRPVLFSHYSNMVISAVHGRAHQIDGTGIYADILFMCMFLMNGSRYKTPVRPQHIAAQLCVKCHLSHSCRYQHFLVDLPYTFAYCKNIIRLLARTVWDSHPS